MTSFALAYFMFFARFPGHCMTYTAEPYGMSGEICNQSATWSTFGSRQFPCRDGVAIRNEDDSLLAVYQCADGNSLVFTGSPKENDRGTVLIYDRKQHRIYNGSITELHGK